MTSSVRVSTSISATFAVALLFILAATTSQPAQAQTFTVLHSFTGGSDGAYPLTGLTLDASGNLYGTTAGGGKGSCQFSNGQGCGIVFKMRRQSAGWTLTPLYSFTGSDGFLPEGRVAFGPNGILYGTTIDGSQQGNHQGTLYSLRPPNHICGSLSCPWTLTTLHRFGNGNDGWEPLGDLTFDGAGSIYGTTLAGGGGQGGTVYKFSAGLETILYNFPTSSNGSDPSGGVIFDNVGNLWGTAQSGGSSGECGVVFMLHPTQSGWAETVVYNFGQTQTDGCDPIGGVIFDPAGHYLGTTISGGLTDAGTLYGPSPYGWSFTSLGNIEGGPTTGLTMDSAGNVYGTTYSDGPYEGGNVFEQAPDGSFVSLHDFTGTDDGGAPRSNVIIDANGNLYGTTAIGGAYGYGVVWEITP